MFDASTEKTYSMSGRLPTDGDPSACLVSHGARLDRVIRPWADGHRLARCSSRIL